MLKSDGTDEYGYGAENSYRFVESRRNRESRPGGHSVKEIVQLDGSTF